MASISTNVARRGSGIPLIAIHGNGVDHRLLLALDDHLAEAGGFERIYVDLPGFGRTPPLPGVGGLPELADWLREFVQAEVGKRPFALLGNSLGGLLARHVAAEFDGQVVGLALLASVVDPDVSKRTLPPRMLAARDDEFLATLAVDDREAFADVAVLQTKDSWEAFSRFALPGVRAANQEAMARLGKRYFLPAVPEEAGVRRDFSALIVTGRGDYIAGFRDQFALLEHYPRATYIALGAAGHNVHLEQPALVGAALREWAGSVAGSALSRS